MSVPVINYSLIMVFHYSVGIFIILVFILVFRDDNFFCLLSSPIMFINVSAATFNSSFDISFYTNFLLGDCGFSYLFVAEFEKDRHKYRPIPAKPKIGITANKPAIIILFVHSVSSVCFNILPFNI